ncbi:MAG TPA: hypothetical protein VN132_10455 [Bdellovibrio sp.]|nr:hypothetical protein [Bdellovibrio sp.]
MWRKIFCKALHVVELVTPSGNRQTISLDDYRERLIEEQRQRVRLAYLGGMPSERYYAIERIIR